MRQLMKSSKTRRGGARGALAFVIHPPLNVHLGVTHLGAAPGTKRGSFNNSEVPPRKPGPIDSGFNPNTICLLL